MTQLSDMKREWWQICKSVRGIQEIFQYSEDEFDNTVLHYEGCLYESVDTSYEEILLKAAIRGDTVLFMTKPNIAQSVILKKNIEMIDYI